MSKHHATHRMVPSRTFGALGLAVAVTIAIGGAAVGVLPQLKADRADPDTSAALGPAAIETAALDTWSSPNQSPSGGSRRRASPRSPRCPTDPARAGASCSTERSTGVARRRRQCGRAYVSGLGQSVQHPAAWQYPVQSKSRHAGAFDGSGTMEYFVRFATGFSEPIGFHSVPKDNSGNLEQTQDELGTPLSAGCVRHGCPTRSPSGTSLPWAPRSSSPPDPHADGSVCPPDGSLLSP